MRIDCDSCGAAYAIDDSLISDRGVRAQCPKCGAQKVVKKGAAPAEGPAAPAPFGGPVAAGPAAPSPFGAPAGGPPAGSSPFAPPATGASPFGNAGPSPFGGPQPGSPFAPPSPPAGSAPFGAPSAPAPQPAAPSPNPFAAPPGTSGGPSPFAAPPGTGGPSPFAAPPGTGGGPSPFAAPPSTGGTPSPFGGPPPSSADIFGAPPATPGAGSPFGGPPAGADPFGARPAGDPFGGPPPPASPFGAAGGKDPFTAPPQTGASPFAAPPQTGAGGDPFGAGGGDIFGGAGHDPFAATPNAGAGSIDDDPFAEPPGASSGAASSGADLFADGGSDADDPFADVPGTDSGAVPVSGASAESSVPWQVKIKGKLQTDIPLTDLRAMIRQGKVGPDDEAGPMGKPLTRVSENAILAVSLPQGTVSRGAAKAQGARASGGGVPVPLIALVVVVALAGVGYGVLRYQPNLFDRGTEAGVNPFKRAQSQWSLQFPDVEGTSQEHVVEARKYMRADTAAGYRKADEHFRMALLLDEGNLDAVGGFVENFAHLPNVRTDADGVALAVDGIEWALRLEPDNPDLLRAQAALKLAIGDVDGAQQVLSRVKVLAKDDLSAKLLLARTHLDRNVNESLELVRAVQRADPERKAALQIAGAAHRRRGEFGLAREQLQERLKADPNNVATLKELARLELDLGEGQAALRWLEQLLKAEERDIEAHLMRAKIAYQVLGDVATAEAQLKFVVDNYEKAAGHLIRDTLAHYAYALAERGKLDEALAVAERGRALDAQYAPIHFVLGRIYTKKRDFEGAKTSFQNAVRLLEVGNDQLYEPIARAYLADAQAMSGDEANAIRNLTRVLEYAPRLAHGYFALAALHMRQGKPGQANTIMRKVLDIDPLHARERLELSDYPSPKSDLLAYADVFARTKVNADDRALKLSSEGIIRFHAGQVSAARNLFVRALKDDRNHHAALLYLAVMDLENGRANNARKRLTQAQRTTAGQHSISQLYLARTELALGDLKQAERRLQDVIENEPTLTQARFTLGELYLKQRKDDEAMKLFRRVVKDAPDYLPVKRMLASR